MPLSGRKLRKLAERLGWVFMRQKGSHMVMKRGSVTISIPDHKELATGTEHDLLREVRRPE